MWPFKKKNNPPADDEIVFRDIKSSRIHYVTAKVILAVNRLEEKGLMVSSVKLLPDGAYFCAFCEEHKDWVLDERDVMFALIAIGARSQPPLDKEAVVAAYALVVMELGDRYRSRI